jgi:hypothetical protein
MCVHTEEGITTKRSTRRNVQPGRNRRKPVGQPWRVPPIIALIRRQGDAPETPEAQINALGAAWTSGLSVCVADLGQQSWLPTARNAEAQPNLQRCACHNMCDNIAKVAVEEAEFMSLSVYEVPHRGSSSLDAHHR